MADLRRRMLTGVAMAVCAAAPIVVGGVAATAFIALVAALLGWEFRRVTRATAGPIDHGLYAGGFALAAALAGLDRPWEAAAVLGLTATGFAALDALKGRSPVWAVIGVALPGAAAAIFAALRSIPEDGFNTVLWVALVVVATDVGAFFAGRMIGGPKLWPRVSPKKTWAGLGGGIALAALTAALFSRATTGTFVLEVATVSAVAALVAQGGDLAESALKRRFGVKDSSSIFPGHGGALDRLDGFVAVTLVAGAVTFARGIPVFRW